MNILRKLERFLNEATITGGLPDTGIFINKGIEYGATASDDDHPTGNILMGRPYTKQTINAPGGAYRNFFPKDEWQWDEFERAKGMEFIGNYHPSLEDDKVLKSHFGKRIFRYSRKREDPTKPMAKINIERDKDPEATMHGIEDIEKEEGGEGVVKEDILIKIDRQYSRSSYQKEGEKKYEI